MDRINRGAARAGRGRRPSGTLPVLMLVAGLLACWVVLVSL